MIKLNKFISILLCFFMLFTMIPFSVYGEDGSDIGFLCSECGLSEGHLEECSSYEIPKEIEDEEDEVEEVNNDNSCICDSIYHIHEDTCPLYVEIETEESKKECTCDLEVHSEDCPLFEEIDVIWTLDLLVEIKSLNELYEIIYENGAIIDDFTNNEKESLIVRIEELYNSIENPTENDIQMRDYLVNLLNSYIIEICEDCGEIDGHLVDCEYYVCEECGLKEHSEDCSLYVEDEDIVICEECFAEDGKHLKDCSQYIEIEEENNICSECFVENGEHLESCSQYIEEPKSEYSPTPSIICSECNGENGEHIYGCSKYKCPECGFDKHLDECSLFICSECGENKHIESCIYYICDECGENEHLETCSLYKCSECGEKEHTKICSKYVDTRSIYEKLLDSSLIEIYELLVNNDNILELNKLTEEEIEDIIYQVGVVSDDTDLEKDTLMLLYSLPNAPTPPWKTLEEDGEIHFDIAYGDVDFTDTTYSGYDENGIYITGEHLETNSYYIEQSNSKTNYTVSVGTEDTPVTQDFEVHLCGVNIDAPRTSAYHKAAVYVNNSAGYVYIIIDDNTTNTLKSYGLIFTNGGGSALLTEENRFGHAAIEKEIGTKGYLVVTCEAGYDIHKDSHDGGHGCSANGPCGILDAYSLGEAGFKGDSTRTSAAAAIGSKAEVSDTADKRTALSGAPTMGTLYNLRIVGGVITATGSKGNTNSDTYLGGSPGIGVGAGFQQYSMGYSTSGFRIYGGYINAIAGDGSSACIGGGYHAGTVTISIYDGTIFATEKATPSTDIKRGTGIGGGGGGSTSNATAGATVYIRGGTIYAHSEFGAAIGSGAGGSSGVAKNATIEISGGTIYAETTKSTGNGAGAAIGSGGSTGSGQGGKATITISGGTIYASSELGADIGGGGTNSKNTSGVGGEAVVTISNGYIEAMSGGIGGGNANAGVGGKATLTVTGGTIYASSINGGDSIKSNGGSASVVISDGILNTGSIGGGRTSSSTANIGSATVDITGGNIHGQIIMDSTNLASGETCYFKMTGGTIDMKKSNNNFDFTFYQENGAVVYIIGGADSTEPIAQVSGGYIKNGSAYNGGAIYITGGGSMLMSGGTIMNCNASNNGGAININGGNFEMTGGTIMECSAKNGGAIYVNGGNILMTAGLLENNTATVNGGAIFVESDSIDVNINIEGGNIMSNSAGQNGGAIGANLQGTSKCYISIGLETCKCENQELHSWGVCPKIHNNIAGISGGAFYCQSIGDSTSTDVEEHILFVDLFCSNITGNKANKYSGSNSLHEENGYFTIYGGEIDDGFVVDGGVFIDSRTKAKKQIIRFWSNYDGGPSTPYEIELTVGYTMYLPEDTYERDGNLLSGWARNIEGTEGYIPIGGEYTVEKMGDGEYVDFYAVWDSQISFIIYIPEGITINEYSGTGTMEISAELNYFNENSLVEVFVNSDFLLILENNPSVTLPYELKTSEPGIIGAVPNGGLVATFEYNNRAMKILTVKLKKWASEFGKYTGNLTFTINFFSGED